MKVGDRVIYTGRSKYSVMAHLIGQQGVLTRINEANDDYYVLWDGADEASTKQLTLQFIKTHR